MSDADRRKAIANAISSGDETFLAAATSGSPTLSGMSAAEQSAAREQWRTKRHPETAARIARLRKGLTQLERLRPMFQKWADQIVEEPNAAAVAAAEATAAAARKAAWLGFARLGLLPLGADARPRCSLAVPRAVGGGGQ